MHEDFFARVAADIDLLAEPPCKCPSAPAPSVSSPFVLVVVDGRAESYGDCSPHMLDAVEAHLAALRTRSLAR